MHKTEEFYQWDLRDHPWKRRWPGWRWLAKGMPGWSLVIIRPQKQNQDHLPLRSSCCCGVGRCATDRCGGIEPSSCPRQVYNYNTTHTAAHLRPCNPPTSTLLTFYNTAECTSYVLADDIFPNCCIFSILPPGTKVVKSDIYLTRP